MLSQKIALKPEFRIRLAFLVRLHLKSSDVKDQDFTDNRAEMELEFEKRRVMSTDHLTEQYITPDASHNTLAPFLQKYRNQILLF